MGFSAQQVKGRFHGSERFSGCAGDRQRKAVHGFGSCSPRRGGHKGLYNFHNTLFQ